MSLKTKLSKKSAENKAAIILSAIEDAYLLGVTCDGKSPKGFAANTLKSLL